MKPADNLIKLFEKLHVPTSTQLDEKIYGEISRATVETDEINILQNGQQDEKAFVVTSIFRRIFGHRKICLTVGISFCFLIFSGILIFFNFNQSMEKTAANPTKPSAQVIPKSDLEINWPKGKLWSDNIRDPMIFRNDKSKLYAVKSNIEGPLVLRGIVYKPKGKSVTLIGTEIFYEGDEIKGWTVKEILKDSVRLEKADGEKLELKMEDR